MRKLLISNALGPCRQLASLAQPTWEQYAHLHGWDVRVHTATPEGAPDRHALKLAKLDVIERALGEADLVLWIDADAMFTNFDFDIAGALQASDFQGLVLEQFANRFNPNTGVWLLRSTEEAMQFLAAVRAAPVPAKYVWADQARVMHALGWQLTPMPHGIKPVHPSPYLARTGWLSPEWNVIVPDGRYPTRIRHFAGQAPAVREQAMTETLAELVRLTTVPAELLDEFARRAIAPFARR